MPVGSVPHGPSRHAAKTDLEQLIPVAVLAKARIHEVRAVREPRRVQRIRRPLPQQTAHQVKDAAQHVRPAGQGGRFLGLEDAAFGNMHIHEVVEAVVEQDLRIEKVDREGPEEHLEHLFVQQEVDRAEGLRVGPGEVEIGDLPFAVQMTGDLVGAVAHAVVVDPVLEIGFLAIDRLRNDHLDDGTHRGLVAVQHVPHRADVDIRPEPVDVLAHAPLGQPQGGDDGKEVGLVPLRHPGVVEHDVEDLVLQIAAAIDLGGRHDDAFLVDHLGIRRQRPRHLATHVRHVAEHRGPADQLALVKDRHHQQPVVQVTDRAVAGIGVVGDEDVAILDRALVAVDEAVEERAELPHDHLAFLVGDHGKGVMLFADARAHRRAEQDRVHLVARVAQGVFDDVERDRVHINTRERLGVGFDNSCDHCSVSSLSVLWGDRRARSGCCPHRR